jgi:hypothetical protein
MSLSSGHSYFLSKGPSKSQALVGFMQPLPGIPPVPTKAPLSVDGCEIIWLWWILTGTSYLPIVLMPSCFTLQLLNQYFSQKCHIGGVHWDGELV